jgi:hypothetical protein
MKSVHFRSFAIAAAAVLTLAGIAAAQDKSTALLNTLEVRQLVARAEPADNARLSAHFSALADRYAAEAKRHISMSQSFVGNPSRNLGTGMSVHCKRLAELNTQSATTVRELAAFHEKLSTGVAAVFPPNAEKFQAGAGAREPNEKDLNSLAAKASTPADHRALAEYFQTLARRYEAEAKEHATFASALRGTRIEQAATIHNHLAALARDAAKEAGEAADMHTQLANVGR